MVESEIIVDKLVISPETKALIESKGLTVDMFEPLDYTVKALDLGIKVVQKCSGRMNEMLVAKNGGEPIINKRDNILEYYTLDAMKKLLDNSIDNFVGEIISIVESKLTNLRISRSEVYQYMNERRDEGKIFSPTGLLVYLFEAYVANEELETLSQMQGLTKRALSDTDVEGKRRGMGVRPADASEIVVSSRKGVLFVPSDRIEIGSIMKFAEIVLNNIKPSQACAEKIIREGESYTNSLMKITYQKTNGKMPVTFHAESDVVKFKEALFKDPEELMKELFGEE